MNLFTKQKQTYKYWKQTSGYQRQNMLVAGGINQELGMNIHTLLYIWEIPNENLLHSTGNSNLYSVITYMRKESKKEWITLLYTPNQYNIIYQLYSRVGQKRLSSRSSSILQLKNVSFSWIYVSVQFSSVAQSCPTPCDPVNRSTTGLPVHHQLSEFTQTHVHRVGDAIQPSHPLLSPFPPVPKPSQHQSLFQ